MLVRKQRGSSEVLKTYTGSPHEMVVNTDHRSLMLFDGETPGGYTIGDEVLIQGPEEVVAGIPNVFTIVNYDSFSEYQVTSSIGTVSLEGPVFTLELEEEVVNVELIIGKVGSSSRVLTISGTVFTGPGPQVLIGGDLTAGFFGEVGPEELISYSGISSLTGVTAGTWIPRVDEESKWLKFALDETILFVMKKPAKHSISWNQINSRGAVYGTSIITIGDNQYKCRLLKGADSDPASVTGITSTAGAGYNAVGTHNSEWNRLFYPVHSGVHTTINNPILPEMESWAQYSDEDLGLDYTATGHQYTKCWCQERWGTGAIGRGYRGVTYVDSRDRSRTGTWDVWRPVLELIP